MSLIQSIKQAIPGTASNNPETDVSASELYQQQSPDTDNSDDSDGERDGSGDGDNQQENGSDGGRESPDSDGNQSGDGDESGAGNSEGDSSPDAESENGGGDGESTDDDGDSDSTQDKTDDGDGGNGNDDDDFTPDEDVLEQERNEVEDEQAEIEQVMNNAKQGLEQFTGPDSTSGSTDASDADLGELQYNIAPSQTCSRERWNEASNGYRHVAKLAEKRLKKARKDERLRGKRAGRPDSTRLHALQTNQLDVMEQHIQGDDRQYAVIIVLDRSGSMSSTDMRIAENSVVKFSLALEHLGVDVCVMDMYNGTPRVTSPFEVSIQNSRGDLLTGETAGGTPLRKMIPIARQRMKSDNKTPLLVSVTDGYPDQEQQYLEQLEKTAMDVLGITIRPGKSQDKLNSQSSRQEEFYDAHTYATSVDELLSELERFTLSLPISGKRKHRA